MSEHMPEVVLGVPALDGPADVPGAGAGPAESKWDSLREIGLWPLMRMLPGLLRSAFQGPAERPGGMTVSSNSPRQQVAVQAAEVDYGDSAPTVEHDESSVEAFVAAADEAGLDATGEELAATLDLDLDADAHAVVTEAVAAETDAAHAVVAQDAAAGAAATQAVAVAELDEAGLS